jgi:hypothetical protein
MKQVFLLFFLSAIVLTSQAQAVASLAGNDESYSPGIAKEESVPLPSPPVYNAWNKGNITLNAGFNVGYIGYSYSGYGTHTGFIPFVFSAEYSINDQISVGGFVGVYGRRYDYDYGNTKYHSSQNTFTAGFRGEFHATHLLNDKLRANIPDNIDIYGAVVLGFRSDSWSSNQPSYQEPSSPGVVVGPSVGARYLFTKQFGVYVETGIQPFGFLGFGATLKL